MNKSIIIGGVLVAGIASVPYFMGKSLETGITSAINSVNKSGFKIENTTTAGYLSTTSNGKIIITDGVAFIENIANNHANEIASKYMTAFLDELSRRDKKELNTILNGMEFTYDSTVSNISANPTINGHISKLATKLQDEMNRQIKRSTPDPLAVKIDSMLKEEKFAFTLKDDRLKIKDIKETVSKDKDKMDIELSGLTFAKTNTQLKTLNFAFESRRENILLNIADTKFNYNIKDLNNYKADLKLAKIEVKDNKNTDMRISNFKVLSDVKTDKQRADINVNYGFDALDFKTRRGNAQINKTNLKINANLDAAGIQKINDIDFNADKRTVQNELKKAIEDIITNTPKIKINLGLNEMLVDNQKLGSEVNTEATLKLQDVKSLYEFERLFKARTPQKLIKHMEGSSLSIVADEKATKSFAPMLRSKGISPVKSKKEGFSEVVAVAKDGGIYINDKRMF